MEWITTRPSRTPDSSQTSLRTASSTDSAGSQKPASVEYQCGGQRRCLPKSTRLASWLTTAMITVGSVRGKERLEIPFLVAQAARSRGLASAEVAPPCAVGREAKSVGGQTRFVPALTDNVGWPQPPQKGFRAFQSRRARACA